MYTDLSELITSLFASTTQYGTRARIVVKRGRLIKRGNTVRCTYRVYCPDESTYELAHATISIPSTKLNNKRS